MLSDLIPTFDPSATITAPGRTASLIAGIGRVSYPMYLWFVDVQNALSRVGLPARYPPRWLSAHSVYIAAAVERPGLALRDRLFPPRASALG